MSRLPIDGENLTLEELHRVVFDGAEAELAPAAKERMNASRAVIERLAESNTPVYGVNTGFGKMATARISRDEIRQLQINLVRSHACGAGAPLSEHATRAMLALRANAIAKGFSGVRPVVAETLIAMLNRGVLPVILSQGSVGASGDLAPLAHLAQVVIGEGEALYRLLATADIGLSPDPKNDFNDKLSMNKILEYMAFELPIVQFDLNEGRVLADEAAIYAKDNAPEQLRSWLLTNL